MLKIFFIVNILILPEKVEIQTKSGQNLYMLESNPRFAINTKLLEHVKKYNRAIILEIDDNNIISIAMFCEKGTVRQIIEDENGNFNISFYEYAAIYKLGKDKQQILQILKKSQIDKKLIRFGHNSTNLELVEVVEDK